MYDWSRFFRVNWKIEKDSNYLLRVIFFVFYLLHANYVKNNLYIHLSFVWCMSKRMRKKLDPGHPILDSDLIGSDRILLFFVGIRVKDSHRIYTVGKIYGILLTDFVGFHRPETIGSCYHIRRNPPLGSKSSVFLSG